MPHIPEKYRAKLRPGIEALLMNIKQVHFQITEEMGKDVRDVRDLDGVMNYVICRLMVEVFNLKENPKYTKFNTVEGILNQVGRAIYEELVSPYEKKKIKENGNALLE